MIVVITVQNEGGVDFGYFYILVSVYNKFLSSDSSDLNCGVSQVISLLADCHSKNKNLSFKV